MTETQKMVVEMVTELEQFSLDEYESVKLILKAQAHGNTHLLEFLDNVFEVVEKYRPKLICMKECVSV